MNFDKTKAIRNAERFLSQGKLRPAIGEYKQIVENDPRDIGSLNMLGDLYAKNSEKKEAVECFTQVAEHYGKQGFAQKAIAVYNKISRLEPDSMEVSAKLAELYQTKGSLSEARFHYTALAEQYQSKGRKIEALAIWKQIAQLDPNNTEVYLKLAEAYWQEDQKDEAADSFIEAGSRLSEQNLHEAALAAYSRAIEIRKTDIQALHGFVKSQISLGYSDEAAKTLETILEQQPYNRDVLYLLVDCHIDTNNPLEAEKAVIRLVEQEPANYPRFLDLVKIYLKNNDLDSAARILSMSSEHLLVGGQADEFLKWVNEILARNPEQLDALRLLVRYYSWQRDEEAFKQSLERLAEVARLNEAVDDERSALSQLVMIAPQDTTYIQRLREINDQYGFTDEPVASAFTGGQAAEVEGAATASEFESFAIVPDTANGYQAEAPTYDFGEYRPENGNGSSANNGYGGDIYSDETLDAQIIEDVETEHVTVENIIAEELTASDDIRLHKEIESIEFYLENGYGELAEKSLKALEEEFGYRPEIAVLREKGGSAPDVGFEVSADVGADALAQDDPPDPEVDELAGVAGDEVIAEHAAEDAVEQSEEVVERTDSVEDVPPIHSMDLNELRNELGLEDTEIPDNNDDDYETHYQTAVAYQEMGLMEDAIKEFQDAINAVTPSDGTRRFFQCANLLGHCFMEKGMPNLALMWFKRALETVGLKEEEKQGLWYELAHAYEADGDPGNAFKYFEQIYAENVDYRDVGQRLQRLHVSH